MIKRVTLVLKEQKEIARISSNIVYIFLFLFIFSHEVCMELVVSGVITDVLGHC